MTKSGPIGTGTDREERYLSEDIWYFTPGAPILIITYAEAKFIESEAQFRAGQKQKAYDAYLAEITANVENLNLPDNAITRYTTLPSAAVGSSNLTQALIMK